MGLYHNVYLVFGAPVTKNEKNRDLFGGVEKLREKHPFDYGHVEVLPFYNGEHKWIVSQTEEIEPNGYTGVGKQFIAHSDKDQSVLISKVADELEVEIGWPSWYVLHDYS